MDWESYSMRTFHYKVNSPSYTGSFTFLGLTAAPRSVKTVAPPACTSLICSRKEEKVRSSETRSSNKFNTNRLLKH